MTDEQTFRLGISLAFNVPTALLAAAYAVMTGITYRRHRETRSLSAFLIALALLAAILAYVVLAAGLIVTGAPAVPREYRTFIFAMRVIFTSVLVIVIVRWLRWAER